MKVKILLSIGYVLLFAILGYRCSLPTPPSVFVTGGLFLLFAFGFAHLWLGIDTISTGSK